MTKHWTVLVTAALASLLALLAPAPLARADIFEWRYINPADPSQGKRQSTKRAPDGAGVNAEPGAYLQYRNLTKAYLIGADLTGAYAPETNLTNADLSGANLTNASFSSWSYPSFGYTVLTGANFTNAHVRGAGFHRSNLSTAQLYSTASYQDHDLSGIDFSGTDLNGANLAGQKLTNAGFSSWDSGPYWHTNLTGANLSGSDVRGAQFSFTPLTGANFTGAEVRGASFSFRGTTGITAAQLYSTASYQDHDLSGTDLSGIDLTGGNLAGFNLTNTGLIGAYLTNANLSHANLTNANFSTGGYYNTDLSGANLSQANLTNANFAGYSYPVYDEYGNYLGDEIMPGANLTVANLSGADARGAHFQYATLSGANATDLIQSDGHITGLNLTAGASLVVRDYDGNPAAGPPTGPLPIVVNQHLAMDATGVLHLLFDADPWNSTISFAPGIPVTRGGTLELTFAPGVNVATQSGRTFDLFDWAGVTPTGAFTVSSPYTWNLTKLYTTGEVTLAAVPSLPGDFNVDGKVAAADYVVWRKGIGVAPTQDNYNIWRAHFGQTTDSGSAAAVNATVPEPTAPATLLTGLVLSMFFRRRPGYDQAC